LAKGNQSVTRSFGLVLCFAKTKDPSLADHNGQLRNLSKGKEKRTHKHKRRMDSKKAVKHQETKEKHKLTTPSLS
jgi:hypothetical protein